MKCASPVDQFNVINAVREIIGPQTSGSSFFHPSISQVLNNTKMSCRHKT